jgi:hypothetical protein
MTNTVIQVNSGYKNSFLKIFPPLAY